MARTPPVPAENQSPYPVAEPAHPVPTTTTYDDTSLMPASLDQGIATAREQVGPLVEKAKQFAKDRPWTAAALLGSLAVAVMGSLRRGRL